MLGQSIKCILAGLAAGILSSLVLTRLMERLLYRVTPEDPLIYVVVALIVMVVAAAAGYLPSRRAVRQDLTAALRIE